MQERLNSSALAMELCLSCTNPLIQYLLQVSSLFAFFRVHGCCEHVAALLLYIEEQVRLRHEHTYSSREQWPLQPEKKHRKSSANQLADPPIMDDSTETQVNS